MMGEEEGGGAGGEPGGEAGALSLPIVLDLTEVRSQIRELEGAIQSLQQNSAGARASGLSPQQALGQLAGAVYGQNVPTQPRYLGISGGGDAARGVVGRQADRQDDPGSVRVLGQQLKLSQENLGALKALSVFQEVTSQRARAATTAIAGEVREALRLAAELKALEARSTPEGIRADRERLLNRPSDSARIGGQTRITTRATREELEQLARSEGDQIGRLEQIQRHYDKIRDSARDAYRVQAEADERLSRSTPENLKSVADTARRHSEQLEAWRYRQLGITPPRSELPPPDQEPAFRPEPGPRTPDGAFAGSRASQRRREGEAELDRQAQEAVTGGRLPSRAPAVRRPAYVEREIEARLGYAPGALGIPGALDASRRRQAERDASVPAAQPGQVVLQGTTGQPLARTTPTGAVRLVTQPEVAPALATRTPASATAVALTPLQTAVPESTRAVATQSVVAEAPPARERGFEALQAVAPDPTAEALEEVARGLDRSTRAVPEPGEEQRRAEGAPGLAKESLVQAIEEGARDTVEAIRSSAQTKREAAAAAPAPLETATPTSVPPALAPSKPLRELWLEGGRSEAQRRLASGESSEQVRAHLLSLGATQTEADQMLWRRFRAGAFVDDIPAKQARAAPIVTGPAGEQPAAGGGLARFTRRLGRTLSEFGAGDQGSVEVGRDPLSLLLGKVVGQFRAAPPIARPRRVVGAEEADTQRALTFLLGGARGQTDNLLQLVGPSARQVPPTRHDPEAGPSDAELQQFMGQLEPARPLTRRLRGAVLAGAQRFGSSSPDRAYARETRGSAGGAPPPPTADTLEAFLAWNAQHAGGAGPQQQHFGDRVRHLLGSRQAAQAEIGFATGGLLGLGGVGRRLLGRATGREDVDIFGNRLTRPSTQDVVVSARAGRRAVEVKRAPTGVAADVEPVRELVEAQPELIEAPAPAAARAPRERRPIEQLRPGQITAQPGTAEYMDQRIVALEHQIATRAALLEGGHVTGRRDRGQAPLRRQAAIALSQTQLTGLRGVLSEAQLRREAGNYAFPEEVLAQVDLRRGAPPPARAKPQAGAPAIQTSAGKVLAEQELRDLGAGVASGRVPLNTGAEQLGSAQTALASAKRNTPKVFIEAWQRVVTILGPAVEEARKSVDAARPVAEKAADALAARRKALLGLNRSQLEGLSTEKLQETAQLVGARTDLHGGTLASQRRRLTTRILNVGLAEQAAPPPQAAAAPVEAQVQKPADFLRGARRELRPRLSPETRLEKTAALERYAESQGLSDEQRVEFTQLAGENRQRAAAERAERDKAAAAAEAARPPRGTREAFLAGLGNDPQRLAAQSQPGSYLRTRASSPAIRTLLKELGAPAPEHEKFTHAQLVARYEQAAQGLRDKFKAIEPTPTPAAGGGAPPPPERPPTAAAPAPQDDDELRQAQRFATRVAQLGVAGVSPRRTVATLEREEPAFAGQLAAGQLAELVRGSFVAGGFKTQRGAKIPARPTPEPPTATVQAVAQQESAPVAPTTRHVPQQSRIHLQDAQAFMRAIDQARTPADLDRALADARAYINTADNTPELRQRAHAALNVAEEKRRQRLQTDADAATLRAGQPVAPEPVPAPVVTPLAPPTTAPELQQAVEAPTDALTAAFGLPGVAEHTRQLATEPRARPLGPAVIARRLQNKFPELGALPFEDVRSGVAAQLPILRATPALPEGVTPERPGLTPLQVVEGLRAGLRSAEGQLRQKLELRANVKGTGPGEPFATQRALDRDIKLLQDQIQTIADQLVSFVNRQAPPEPEGQPAAEGAAEAPAVAPRTAVQKKLDRLGLGSYEGRLRGFVEQHTTPDEATKQLIGFMGGVGIAEGRIPNSRQTTGAPQDVNITRDELRKRVGTALTAIRKEQPLGRESDELNRLAQARAEAQRSAASAAAPPTVYEGPYRTEAERRVLGQSEREDFIGRQLGTRPAARSRTERPLQTAADVRRELARAAEVRARLEGTRFAGRPEEGARIERLRLRRYLADVPQDVLAETAGESLYVQAELERRLTRKARPLETTPQAALGGAIARGEGVNRVRPGGFETPLPTERLFLNRLTGVTRRPARDKEDPRENEVVIGGSPPAWDAGEWQGFGVQRGRPDQALLARFTRTRGRALPPAQPPTPSPTRLAHLEYAAEFSRPEGQARAQAELARLRAPVAPAGLGAVDVAAHVAGGVEAPLLRTGRLEAEQRQRQLEAAQDQQAAAARLATELMQPAGYRIASGEPEGGFPAGARVLDVGGPVRKGQERDVLRELYKLASPEARARFREARRQMSRLESADLKGAKYAAPKAELEAVPQRLWDVIAEDLGRQGVAGLRFRRIESGTSRTGAGTAGDIAHVGELREGEREEHVASYTQRIEPIYGPIGPAQAKQPAGQGPLGQLRSRAIEMRAAAERRIGELTGLIAEAPARAWAYSAGGGSRGTGKGSQAGAGKGVAQGVPGEIEDLRRRQVALDPRDQEELNTQHRTLRILAEPLAATADVMKAAELQTATQGAFSETAERARRRQGAKREDRFFADRPGFDDLEKQPEDPARQALAGARVVITSREGFKGTEGIVRGVTRTGGRRGTRAVELVTDAGKQVFVPIGSGKNKTQFSILRTPDVERQLAGEPPTDEQLQSLQASRAEELTESIRLGDERAAQLAEESKTATPGDRRLIPARQREVRSYVENKKAELAALSTTTILPRERLRGVEARETVARTLTGPAVEVTLPGAAPAGTTATAAAGLAGAERESAVATTQNATAARANAEALQGEDAAIRQKLPLLAALAQAELSAADGAKGNTGAIAQLSKAMQATPPLIRSYIQARGLKALGGMAEIRSAIARDWRGEERGRVAAEGTKLADQAGGFAESAEGLGKPEDPQEAALYGRGTYAERFASRFRRTLDAVQGGAVLNRGLLAGAVRGGQRFLRAAAAARDATRAGPEPGEPGGPGLTQALEVGPDGQLQPRPQPIGQVTLGKQSYDVFETTSQQEKYGQALLDAAAQLAREARGTAQLNAMVDRATRAEELRLNASHEALQARAQEVRNRPRVVGAQGFQIRTPKPGSPQERDFQEVVTQEALFNAQETYQTERFQVPARQAGRAEAARLRVRAALKTREDVGQLLLSTPEQGGFLGTQFEEQARHIAAQTRPGFRQGLSRQEQQLRPEERTVALGRTGRFAVIDQGNVAQVRGFNELTQKQERVTAKAQESGAAIESSFGRARSATGNLLNSFENLFRGQHAGLVRFGLDVVGLGIGISILGGIGRIVHDQVAAAVENEAQWERTARSVTAIYGERAQYIRQFSEILSRNPELAGTRTEALQTYQTQAAFSQRYQLPPQVTEQLTAQSLRLARTYGGANADQQIPQFAEALQQAIAGSGEQLRTLTKGGVDVTGGTIAQRLGIPLAAGQTVEQQAAAVNQALERLIPDQTTRQLIVFQEIMRQVGEGAAKAANDQDDLAKAQEASAKRSQQAANDVSYVLGGIADKILETFLQLGDKIGLSADQLHKRAIQQGAINAAGYVPFYSGPGAAEPDEIRKAASPEAAATGLDAGVFLGTAPSYKPGDPEYERVKREADAAVKRRLNPNAIPGVEGAAQAAAQPSALTSEQFAQQAAGKASNLTLAITKLDQHAKAIDRSAASTELDTRAKQGNVEAQRLQTGALLELNAALLAAATRQSTAAQLVQQTQQRGQEAAALGQAARGPDFPLRPLTGADLATAATGAAEQDIEGERAQAVARDKIQTTITQLKAQIDAGRGSEPLPGVAGARPAQQEYDDLQRRISAHAQLAQIENLRTLNQRLAAEAQAQLDQVNLAHQHDLLDNAQTANTAYDGAISRQQQLTDLKVQQLGIEGQLADDQYKQAVIAQQIQIASRSNLADERTLLLARQAQLAVQVQQSEYTYRQTLSGHQIAAIYANLALGRPADVGQLGSLYLQNYQAGLEATANQPAVDIAGRRVEKAEQVTQGEAITRELNLNTLEGARRAVEDRVTQDNLDLQYVQLREGRLNREVELLDLGREAEREKAQQALLGTQAIDLQLAAAQRLAEAQRANLDADAARVEFLQEQLALLQQQADAAAGHALNPPGTGQDANINTPAINRPKEGRHREGEPPSPPAVATGGKRDEDTNPDFQNTPDYQVHEIGRRTVARQQSYQDLGLKVNDPLALEAAYRTGKLDPALAFFTHEADPRNIHLPTEDELSKFKALLEQAKTDFELSGKLQKDAADTAAKAAQADLDAANQNQANVGAQQQTAADARQSALDQAAQAAAADAARQAQLDQAAQAANAAAAAANAPAPAQPTTTTEPTAVDVAPPEAPVTEPSTDEPSVAAFDLDIGGGVRGRGARVLRTGTPATPEQIVATDQQQAPEQPQQLPQPTLDATPDLAPVPGETVVPVAGVAVPTRGPTRQYASTISIPQSEFDEAAAKGITPEQVRVSNEFGIDWRSSPRRPPPAPPLPAGTPLDPQSGLPLTASYRPQAEGGIPIQPVVAPRPGGHAVPRTDAQGNVWSDTLWENGQVTTQLTQSASTPVPGGTPRTRAQALAGPSTQPDQVAVGRDADDAAQRQQDAAKTQQTSATAQQQSSQQQQSSSSQFDVAVAGFAQAVGVFAESTSLLQSVAAQIAAALGAQLPPQPQAGDGRPARKPAGSDQAPADFTFDAPPNTVLPPPEPTAAQQPEEQPGTMYDPVPRPAALPRQAPPAVSVPSGGQSAEDKLRVQAVSMVVHDQASVQQVAQALNISEDYVRQLLRSSGAELVPPAADVQPADPNTILPTPVDTGAAEQGNAIVNEGTPRAPSIPGSTIVNDTRGIQDTGVPTTGPVFGGGRTRLAAFRIPGVGDAQDTRTLDPTPTTPSLGDLTTRLPGTGGDLEPQRYQSLSFPITLSGDITVNDVNAIEDASERYAELARQQVYAQSKRYLTNLLNGTGQRLPNTLVGAR